MTAPVPAAARGTSPARGTSTGGGAAGRWATVVVPALVAYVPLLLTRPGQVGADTKTYLYLDPGRLLAGAPTMWDAETGMGTVSHQNIGYLFPMGPFYWVLEQIGLPDWVAQRLWLGTVLFLAALGVRFLLCTIAEVPARFSWGAVLVAALGYQLSPYVLDYAARISVILLPWVALPWLVALAQRSVRRGGWRWPACFALVALAAGGINATALILMAAGPLLWFVYEWRIERVVPGRRVARAVVRCGLLTFVTSLWWMAGLWAQGGYGLPVLRFTESYKTVAEAASSVEVLRGLGYWFFYGEDKLGQWIEPSEDFTTTVWVLVVSFLVPLLALLAAAAVRWRHRAYFLVLLVVGVLGSVASHPWDGASPLGGAFRALTRTDAGLALRSTPRAVPLVALAAAVLLGAGVHAVSTRLPRYAGAVGGIVVLLLFANLPTLWKGEMVAANLQRPEDIPEYWVDAIEHLDARGTATRILEIPGADFASYRWGNTVDPVTPGLTDRPYVARELFQYGTEGGANLLIALDRGLHDRTVDPDALAPVAQLMGVGDVVLRSDLQYERYRIGRPRILWDTLEGAPGFDEPIAFGDATPNVAGPEHPLVDEIELGADPDLDDPAPVVVLPVRDARPIVRAVSADRPLLLAGDGDGLVAAAGAGLVDPDQAIFYSATFADDAEGFEEVLGAGADLLVTDSNRARGRRWGGLRENTGYTEQAGEVPLRADPTDNRLELFPGAPPSTETVTVQDGLATAVATSYGNPVTFTADERAANAIDGDPMTAWRVGAIGDPTGERLVLTFDEPVTADRLELVQPLNLNRNRWITDVRLRFDDGGAPFDTTLTATSHDLPGEEVVFGPRTFERLEIEIVDTDVGRRPRYDGLTSVGFAEVTIPGVGPTREIVRPPTDLLAAAGEASIDHRVVWLFTRARTDPAEPVRLDEEPAMIREVTSPVTRRAAVWGEARLSAIATDGQLEALLGAEASPTVTASGTLPGAIDHRPRAAFDGDPSTTHTFPFGDQRGGWVQAETETPTTIDRIGVTYVDDGRHSTPTRLRLDVDGVPAALLEIPADARADDEGGEAPGSTSRREAILELPSEVTGSRFRLTVEDVDESTTRDWYTGGSIALPVSLAEVSIAGVAVAPLPERIDTGCRDDLVALDGEPVEVRITGTTADAVARRPLALEGCGAARDGVEITAGDHVLSTVRWSDGGIEIDQVALASERGGRPLPHDEIDDVVRPPAPEVTVEGEGRSSFDLEVAPTDTPYWLVLGQSLSPGWQATAEGESLGEPVLVNGYANGWYVDPATAGGTTEPVSVRLDWTPQRVIWVALAVSAVAALVCVALALAGGRRARRPATGSADLPLVARPDEPELAGPLSASELVPFRAATVATAGVVVFAVLDLPVGWPSALAVVVGAATWAALRWRRGAGLAAAAAVAAFGAAATYVVVQQVRHEHPADFIWPQQFDLAHPLGLLAVLLLAAQAVRDLTTPGAVAPRRPASPPSRIGSGGRPGTGPVATTLTEPPDRHQRESEERL